MDQREKRWENKKIGIGIAIGIEVNRDIRVREERGKKEKFRIAKFEFRNQGQKPISRRDAAARRTNDRKR